MPPAAPASPEQFLRAAHDTQSLAGERAYGEARALRVTDRAAPAALCGRWPHLVRAEDGRHLLLSARGRPPPGATTFPGLCVSKLGQRAGIGPHPHALRRAIATHLVGAGVSVHAVQAFLGHHDLASTELYLEVRRAQLRRAVEVLERR